jgi:hypothetical protein
MKKNLIKKYFITNTKKKRALDLLEIFENEVLKPFEIQYFFSKLS